ncbi:MAG: ROK family protein [Rhodomicrobium sp.]
MWRIGIDLGGTKIEALALSPEGAERGRIRIPSPQQDYEATLNAITSLVETCTLGLAAADIAGIGIGIPGSISPRTGLVRNANSTWLNGRPLHSDLQARLQWPLKIENDANCFALSEAADGAAQGCRMVFGVILGTGVGGGLVIDGRPIIGRNAIAGEWGHNPLPWPEADETPGPFCYCGKRGCIETFLSGPALEGQYQQLSGILAEAKSIASRAEQGEENAKAVLATYARRLAKALATVINVADPDVIVFGGGLSNVSAIREMAEAELPDWVFSDCFSTPVRANRWGDSSGVRGAAWLVCPR